MQPLRGSFPNQNGERVAGATNGLINREQSRPGFRFDPDALRSTTFCRIEYTMKTVKNDIPKVPKNEFDAVLGALLKAPPLPLADIPRTREPKPKPKRPTAKKKRG